MLRFQTSVGRAVARGAGFAVASNAAVLFVLMFGQVMWPQGLPAHSQNVLWLASGVNLAGLLLLGRGYWPVILLDAFPAHWIAGEPLDLTLLASFCNAMESLLAAWMIQRFCGFDGRLDRLRPVALLLIASIVAPLINTLLIPAYFCLNQVFPWSEYGRALSQWNLSNGAAMLMGTSLILSIARGNWVGRSRWKEGLVLATLTLSTCYVAFDALFSGHGFNFAFIVFPVVIYAAVRFGVAEVSVALTLVLAAIFASVARHVHAIPASEMATTIWFTQAFNWVLAATGLIVAALVSERRRAEELTSLEKSRTLEASVRESRARLDALRYQINPHFLFNTLNSVRAEIPLAQPVAREMLTGLAEYLRSTLDRPETDLAPLREELGSTECYLAIEKKRFGERLQLKVEVDPAALSVNVPVFLLQPLVENAIRHGLEAMKGACQVRITAKVEAGMLRIEVANTGAWKQEGERKGLGLENIRGRLELLYGPAGNLTRIEEEGWVCFQVVLPVKGAVVHDAVLDR